jgi:hypothetical protein
LIPTFVTSFDFLSLKNDVNAPSKSNKQKIFFLNTVSFFVSVLKVSLSEGLGKEYKKWRETTMEKTGTQAEGRHVVIRASQG